MKKRVFITILSLVFMGLSGGALRAQTWNIGPAGNPSAVTATLSGNTLTISGSGAMMNWTLPQYIPWNGLYRGSIHTVVIDNGVTSIGEHAFNSCSDLTSVSISNSVTSIGDYAFYYCIGLTSITIPNSVTSIGYYAFYHCTGITSITIPNSVTSIGTDAFFGCDRLTSIDVASGNPAYSSENGVLFNKNKTTLVRYPKGKPEASYVIPNSVTSIGNGAFSDCTGLTSITIPNSVTSIGYSAFSDCTGITSITIPNSVTSIGNSAFSRSGLTSITIPNSVTSIEYNVFSYCTGLTSITIPNSVTSIENYAFYHCTGLTSITIPNSVTSIGTHAFFDCTGLGIINVKAATPPTIDSYTFIDIPTTIPVHVPCGTQNAYQTAPYWSVFTNIIADIAPEITVQSANNTMGTASITQPNTCENSQAIIAATPNAGYSFVRWSDGNTSNPRTVAVTQDSLFTAEFDIASGIIEVTSVSLNTASRTIVIGETYQLTATVSPANATNRKVSWSSSNTAIATVSDSGLIKAVGEGTATITVTTQNGGFTASCSVNVQKNQTVVVDEGKPAGENGTGTITVSLEIPSNVPFSGTFKLTLPNGMSVDMNATQLPDALKTTLSLSITQASSNTWLFTITTAPLRSATDMSYQKIMDIVYKVEKSTPDGAYNATISDLNLVFDNGTSITESKIPVSITVDHSYTGLPDVSAEVKSYISGNILYVNSPVGEVISLYSVSGTLLYSTKKPAGEVQIPLHRIQDKVLIVRSSSGWVIKGLRTKS